MRAQLLYLRRALPEPACWSESAAGRFTNNRLLGSALAAQRQWQRDRRAAEADQLTQISGADVSAGRKLDRRHIGTDRTQIVGDRSRHQCLRAISVGRDGSAVKFRGPAAVGAAIHHSAVADAVGGYHHRAGDFDLFLFEWRGHWTLIAKWAFAAETTRARAPPSEEQYFI